MSAAENKAIFLSYASQDAEAARRICEALRASGVEVWFDQSELRGGDAWDQKIRKQIKDCALFVPVISANTQARREGYFRLEWKLAVDRSHLMADDAHFLLPIVIDDTPDATARVPDKFRDVQWMRLNVKDTPETLARRVARLLSGAQPAEAGDRRPEAGNAHRRSKHDRSRWIMSALAGAVALAAAIGAWFALRPSSPPATGLPSPASPAAPAAVSEARQLADRARAMSLDKYDSSIDDFTAAEGLVKRALELDPNDGEIWAVSSLINFAFNSRGFERTPARNAAARAHAERALKLAPDSVEALFALARWQRDSEEPAIAEASFRKVLARNPDHVGALHNLGYLYDRMDRIDEAAALYAREAKNPAAAALAGFTEYLMYFRRARFAEAEQAVRKSIAVEPSSNAQSGLALLLLTWKGDAEAAAAAVATGPATIHREHRPIWVTAFAHLCRRQPADTLRVLERLPDEYILDNMYTGPKAYWVGLAHAQAGREAAARVAWEAGLALVDQRLRNTPADFQLRLARGELLAWLGREAEALQEVRTLEQLAFREQSWIFTPVRIYAALGRADDALKLIEPQLQFTREHRNLGWPLTPALLRIDPRWDKLRGDPRFRQLCEELAAVVTLSPKADDKSVAVLPFANMSADKENEFFTDGIHEDILTNLARIRELRVVSRTSVMQYRGTTKSMKQLAQELGVTYILEGSVRRAGNKVRVTGQLIHAASDEHVWAQTYDRDLTDIFSIQSELATAIAGELKAALSPEEKSRVQRAQTSSLAAYEAYLKAIEVYDHAQFKVEELIKAEALLQTALELDPKFTQAWRSLSEISFLIYNRSQGRPAERTARLELAKRAIETVERLAPDEPETWLSQASYYANTFDYPRAEQYIQRAAEALPNNAMVVVQLADMDARHGRYRAALARYQQAYRLDRQNPTPRKQLLLFLIHMRRYDEAETILTEFPDPFWSAGLRFHRSGDMREIGHLASGDPTISGGNWAWTTGDAATYVKQVDELRQQQGGSRFDSGTESRYMLSLLVLGETVRAREQAQQMLAANPHAYLPLAVLGRKDEAMAAVEEQAARLVKEGVTPYSFLVVQKAQVLTWSGDKEQAIAEIVRLLQTPSALNVHVLRRGVAWRPLQGDPRFEAILADPKNNAPLF